MKQLLCAALIAALLIGFAGCAKKKVAQPTEQAPPGGAESLVETDTQRQPTKPPSQDVQKDTITEKPLKPGETAERELTPEELGAKIQDIHFDYDRYDIREDAKPTMKAEASALSKNKGVKVIIEGHCDDRGTNEYNLALGERRAKAARDFLMSLGVPSSHIGTVSYGEEKPLCADASESCWAKNRRAHFVFVKETR
jgi:peptidoglycan-associated lipoprotein